MNIELARAIPIADILKILGAIRTKQNSSDEWYLSPFRNEKTASFHVNIRDNLWYDFGEAIGGNSIDLVCEHLKRSGVDNTVADALRWLRNMTQVPIINLSKPERSKTNNKLKIKSVSEIRHLALKRYLGNRGIELELAKFYLKELYFQNSDTETKMFALGLPNEDGGWELRNPFFKGSIGAKSITFIRGRIPKPDSIDVFEGMFDFLSLLTDEKKKQFDGDVIVLNSTACIHKGWAYIKGYGYLTVRTWFDNDKAGQKATETFHQLLITEPDLKHVAMNNKYAQHNDVNAWLMHSLSLKVQP